jgi:PPOX class probable F420-dependent enzyme
MAIETPALNEDVVELLKGKNIGHLVTLMPDGSPQVTPIWVDTDGKHVLVNTAAGRLKDRNLRRDPRVAIEVSDSENPYHYVQIRGRVADVTTEGAKDHIRDLNLRYQGNRDYPLKPDEERVIFKIAPQQVQLS